MKMNFHSTVLFVKNIEESCRFYTDVLGQEIEYDFGGNIILKCGLTLWQIQEEHVINRTLIDKKQYDKYPMELCFETEKFENAVMNIKEAKAKLMHDVKEENWGQLTIRFYDPDNNLIEVGESLKTFITRLLSNMSIGEVSKKSGVKVEDIHKIISEG